MNNKKLTNISIQILQIEDKIKRLEKKKSELINQIEQPKSIKTQPSKEEYKERISTRPDLREFFQSRGLDID